jgi:L-threonylcarbamoyladenylate synthase
MKAEDTRILRIDPVHPEPEHILPVCDVLRRDGVILYPTETFYGLGANVYSARAIKKIYGLKSRGFNKPLSVVICDIPMLKKVAAEIPPVLNDLAESFWPGPLTLILAAAPDIPFQLLAGFDTIAVRIPGHAWLRCLIREAGFPLTSTSANLSGDSEHTDPYQAAASLQGKVDLIVDGGITQGESASTIVDLTSDPPRIVRQGAVPRIRLKRYLG